MSRAWGTYHSYKQVDVETASQGKLVVMLFNGAIRRAATAKALMADNKVVEVHENLVRAQDIISELRSALDLNAGAVVADIDRIYEYLGHLLIQANIQKSTAPIDEFLGHAEELRDTWQEAFNQAARETPDDVPLAEPNAAARVNIQG